MRDRRTDGNSRPVLLVKLDRKGRRRTREFGGFAKAVAAAKAAIAEGDRWRQVWIQDPDTGRVLYQSPVETLHCPECSGYTHIIAVEGRGVCTRCGRDGDIETYVRSGPRYGGPDKGLN
jgi:hypothetical protein